MYENKEQMESVIQNLKDAGCDDACITHVIELMKKNETEVGLCALRKYRKTLLEAIHTEQKKLDCLDYLIFQIKNRKAE